MGIFYQYNAAAATTTKQFNNTHIYYLNYTILCAVYYIGERVGDDECDDKK